MVYTIHIYFFRNNIIFLLFFLFTNSYANSDLSNYKADYELFRAKQDLKKAESELEVAKAYFQIGAALFKTQDYYESIIYINKSDSIFEKINSIEDIFSNHFLLTMQYRDLGLLDKSEMSWKKLLEVSKDMRAKFVMQKDDLKLKNLDYMINQGYALKYEKEKNYIMAIPYRKAISDYMKEMYSITKERSYYILLFSTYNTLAFDLFKSNKITEGEKYLNLSIELNKNIRENESHLMEMFYMDRGILYALKNDKKNSAKWFDKAEKLAKYRNNKGYIESINEQRIFYNVDNEGSYIISELTKIYNDRIINTGKLIKHELSIKERELNFKKNLIYFVTSFIILIIIIFIFILKIKEKRRKKAFIEFNNIIENLKNRDKIDLKIRNKKTRSNILISENKKQELLLKLKEFEESDIYLSSNFSLSNLTSYLNTNIKYTNAILTEMNQTSFSEYINDLRIKYIVKELYNNKSLLNYKIESLANISGFSSHSRFTHIFKKRMKISPSEYIENLRKKNAR